MQPSCHLRQVFVESASYAQGHYPVMKSSILLLRTQAISTLFVLSMPSCSFSSQV